MVPPACRRSLHQHRDTAGQRRPDSVAAAPVSPGWAKTTPRPSTRSALSASKRGALVEPLADLGRDVVVALLIFNYEGDFNKLSDQLKLKPTSTHEPKNKSEVRRWELSSGISESKKVEEHLEALIEKLKPSASQLKELTAKYRCSISVGLEYYEYNPEITFSPGILQSLGALNVAHWLDIYNLWDNEES
jgi:Domain of unknown function (DUF4279)